MELLKASFALINFPFTVLALLVALYWITVILGALDVTVLDFSFEPEGGLDGEAGDAGDAAHGDSGGFLRAFLHYLYIGEVPVTIVISILAVSLWAFAVLANHYLNPQQRVWLAAALLIPNLLAGIHVAKFVSLPLRKLFRAIDRDGQTSMRLVGRRCRIVTSEATPEFGQAEIAGDGAPIRLSVRTRAGETLPQGAEAVILESDPDKGVHLVARLDEEPETTR